MTRAQQLWWKREQEYPIVKRPDRRGGSPRILAIDAPVGSAKYMREYRRLRKLRGGPLVRRKESVTSRFFCADNRV